MRKFTKILSVALVVVMMVSMFAFNTSALEDGKTLGLVLRADKTEAEIVPGAVVTVTFHFELADYEQLMSDMRLCLVYDKSVYTPDVSTRTFIGDLADYAKDATAARDNDTFGQTCFRAAGATADELALYDGGVMIQVGADTTLGANNKRGFLMTEGDDGVSIGQITMEFTVTGDEAAIAAGSKNIIWPAVIASSSQYIKYTDGSSTPKQYATTNGDFAKNNILANMTVAPATPLSVAPLKTQIKYNDIYTDGDGNEVATFNYRIIAELDNFYDIYTDANDAADISDGNGITEAGFIYNRGSAVDVDKAMEQINGGTVTYPGKQHQKSAYISMTAISGKVAMACVVYNIPDTDAGETLSVLAYLKYVQDGEEKIAYCDAYTGTFTLYSSDGR